MVVGASSQQSASPALLSTAAGAVVKSGEIYAGAPAKLLRKLSAEEKGFVAASADNYAKLATEHR
jgi:carbonic anhydrase/acetyltransferase-like protein (isoleucine patch superfamily)